MFALSHAAPLRNALRVLLPLSLLLTAYLYLYPALGQCAFPLPKYSTADNDSLTTTANAFLITAKSHLPQYLGGPVAKAGPNASPFAPFRLLALGDPQLEGDTSIPNAHSTSTIPHLSSAFTLAAFGKRERLQQEAKPNAMDDAAGQAVDDEILILRERIRLVLHDLVDFLFIDVPLAFASLRKRLDLVGNDYYLAHIYRTVRWWTMPTHVAVLGDLLGSQWVDDVEFSARSYRYWHRVMRGGGRVPDNLAFTPTDEYDLSGYLGAPPHTNETQDAWTNRIINVVGNHDIGYAGDITEERLARFEREFGKANYELRFELPLDRLSPEAASSVYDAEANPDSDRLVPELRIVNLNDMNLDTPAQSPALQDQTYAFINAVINTASAVESQGHFTIVLTHIPLYKSEGICVDAPYFSFHDDGTLQEQNLLSEDASRGLLQGIFGMHGDVEAPGSGKGRPGVILNGHDHEGCDTYHFVNQSRPIPVGRTERPWETVQWPRARSVTHNGCDGYPGIREITVRSMMGGFGGNAGLFSAWFDETTWSWKFEYETCALGQQHMWWAVHILDLFTFGVLAVYGFLLCAETVFGVKRISSPKN